jgi:hypothetical protein
MVKCPRDFFMLCVTHEARTVNQDHGFYAAILAKLDSPDLWEPSAHFLTNYRHRFTRLLHSRKLRTALYPRRSSHGRQSPPRTRRRRDD